MARKTTPYWTKVIEQAEKRKKQGKEPFTEAQKARAEDWVTCACGKQSGLIPRHDDGEPCDFELGVLGHDFYCEVLDGEPTAAKRILAKIEKRAALVEEAELLRRRLEELEVEHDIHI